MEPEWNHEDRSLPAGEGILPQDGQHQYMEPGDRSFPCLGQRNRLAGCRERYLIFVMKIFQFHYDVLID